MKRRRTSDQQAGPRGGAPCGVEALEGRMLLAGNGLAGTYYDNANLSGASVARTDPTVNFDWGTGAPAAGIGADTFSARWTGQVQARFTQLYTFSTDSDDGVRVWVDGKLIVDDWNAHARQINRGQIFLTQGQRYDIKVEYFDQGGGAFAQLWWNSHTQRGQVIPKDYLFSDAGPTGTPTPNPAVTGPVRVSSNGRYFEQADGRPFFYMADTAWTMPVELSRTDVDFYLKTRASQGYNVVQMVATDEHYAVKNVYGQAPLLNNNPSTPNTKFFEHVDYIVGKAAQYGITVAIMPTWGRNVADVDYRIFNPTSAYNYGKFLGNRYRNAPNVMWTVGGDWPLTDATTTAIWRSMAKGLGDGDGGRHLITFHPKGGDTAREYFGNGESWMDFAMTQSGHRRDSAAYDLITSEYNRSPVMPVLDGEINYERMPVNAVEGTLRGPLMNDYDVRKKAYWTVFAGGAGVAYGANEVFQFYVPGTKGGTKASMDWHDAIFLPGATQMKFLRSLIDVRAFMSRVPDQSVITTATYTGTNHIQATRDANGSFALVYSGGGQAFTVNMAKITGGRVEANWYNPRNGKRTPIGVYANSGTRRFVPPTSGDGNDWVLMLDRA
jgi:hypothetical protein